MYFINYLITATLWCLVPSGWLGGIVSGKVSDKWLRGRGFESHQDRFWASYGAQANSAFHPSGVGKWVAVSIW